MSTPNPPTEHMKMTFQYGKIKGYFHVWEVKERGKWQWEALGHSGEEVGKEAAIAAARRWIIEGTIN